MPCRVKRAYAAPHRTDGFRVLVDRPWPRGLKKKEDAAIDPFLSFGTNRVGDCHQAKASSFLRASRGEKVELDKAYLVCGRCHPDRLKDWYFGAHGKRVASWHGERILYNCTACHDPHDPGIKPRKPQPPPTVRIGLTKM